MNALLRVAGPDRTATHTRQLARRIAELDGIPSAAALRLARERVEADDPFALAAPGQVWALREDADEDDAPACALGILARTAQPPALLAQDEHGTVETLPLDVLDLFHLATWEDQPWA
ncbi:hypothetical protein ACFVVX_01135 [Kitasatospora sp. NPDC058170]|uniref:hypothetical protein n=1 Tax=Kitasatospora sp. NPDC058170 TaxID=3346364 RepID=UPI0036DB5DD1